MRIAIPSFFVLGLAGLFIFGMLTNSIAPAMGAFCLWTPAVFWLGWAMARSGLRVSIGLGMENAPARRRKTPAFTTHLTD